MSLGAWFLVFVSFSCRSGGGLLSSFGGHGGQTRADTKEVAVGSKFFEFLNGWVGSRKFRTIFLRSIACHFKERREEGHRGYSSTLLEQAPTTRAVALPAAASHDDNNVRVIIIPLVDTGAL